MAPPGAAPGGSSQGVRNYAPLSPPRKSFRSECTRPIVVIADSLDKTGTLFRRRTPGRSVPDMPKSQQKHIIYYVSGHGFGHGRRAAEVMAALFRRHPSVEIHVRTSAPAWLF